MLKFDRKDPNKVFALAVVITYFFFLIVSTYNTPFPSFTTTLYNSIPFAYTLAVHHSYPIFIFLFSFMIGYAIANISEIINKRRLYYILFIFVILIFISACLYNYEYALIKQYAPHSPFLNPVPAYVYDISRYINSHSGSFSVGTLPAVNGQVTAYQYTNWYYGVNVYQALIKSSVYTGSINVYDEFFSPQIPQEYYQRLAETIDTAPVNYSIFNVFSVFGIRYIIVQGDTLHFSNSSPYAPVWDANTIYDNLNRSKNIRYVGSYNTSTIFEIINYTPLVYASNIKSIYNSSIAFVFNTIENNTFDTSNTVVYTTQNIGLYNSTGKLSVSNISSFIQPDISFNYLSPTKAVVRVLNASTPFYLIFRETYDPGWNAYYSNGTAVNQDALLYNGFQIR